MIPSSFFGEEHVTLSGVMIGRIKSIIFLLTPILSFRNSFFQLLPIMTPLMLDQLTYSVPRNVTTYYEEKDEIIHFCLSRY